MYTDVVTYGSLRSKIEGRNVLKGLNYYPHIPLKMGVGVAQSV
jgi:hypothetical protein